MIPIIVIVLVLVYESFCNGVCIHGHANKASCSCYLALPGYNYQHRLPYPAVRALKNWLRVNALLSSMVFSLGHSLLENSPCYIAQRQRKITKFANSQRLWSRKSDSQSIYFQIFFDLLFNLSTAQIVNKTVMKLTQMLFWTISI